MRDGTMVAALALLCAGCWTETEHPLFETKDARAEPLLEGIWKIGDQRYLIARQGTDAYRLTALDAGEGVEPGDEVRWILSQWQVKALKTADKAPPLRLVKVGEHYFLDTLSGGLVCTTRISFAGPGLRIAPLNTEWLKEYLRQHPRALKHKVRRERDTEILVLNAETKDLQNFVLEHLDDLFGFSVPGERVGKTFAPLFPEKGPADKGQRAFDAWYEFRQVGRVVPIYPRNSCREVIENAEVQARQLRALVHDALDAEAADSLRELTAVYDTIARVLPSRDKRGDPLVEGLRDLLAHPEDKLPLELRRLAPVQEQLRKALATAAKASAALGKRYDRTFASLKLGLSE
jgi:hypothetical protein